MKVDKLKELARSILDQEIKDNKLNVNYEVLTPSELDRYREKYNLKKSDNDSFYDEKNNTIFLVVDDYVDKVEEAIFDVSFECFHEIRHVIQKSFNKNSYEGFFYFIDEVNSNNYFDYDVISHSGYSFEIGANLYGIKKTKEYMENYYPSLYDKYKEEIDLTLRMCESEYLVYNASSRFNIFMSQLKRNMKANRVRWNDQEKVNNNDKIIPDIFKIFINLDGSLKSFDEIIKDENFSKMDKRIVYAIISSESFLNRIDINKLSSFELSLLNNALNYTKQLNEKQIRWRKELFENEKHLYNYRIKNDDSILGKIILIKKLYTNILLYNIRFNNFYKKDREFFRNIALKKVEKTIKNENFNITKK